tara:strand:+ start:1025 stop:1195 length:171 start_codon:yes stop_codon:yes gene_type:complete
VTVFNAIVTPRNYLRFFMECLRKEARISPISLMHQKSALTHKDHTTLRLQFDINRE